VPLVTAWGNTGLWLAMIGFVIARAVALGAGWRAVAQRVTG
jgi:hypothetical protein